MSPPRKDNSRTKLLAAVKALPDEAFGWFVAWAQGKFAIQFPDGLGGFQPESRAAIERLQKEATAYQERYGEQSVVQK